jgi:hypothetical protein
MQPGDSGHAILREKPLGPSATSGKSGAGHRIMANFTPVLARCQAKPANLHLSLTTGGKFTAETPRTSQEDRVIG